MVDSNRRIVNIRLTPTWEQWREDRKDRDRQFYIFMFFIAFLVVVGGAYFMIGDILEPDVIYKTRTVYQESSGSLTGVYKLWLYDNVGTVMSWVGLVFGLAFVFHGVGFHLVKR